MSAEAKYPEHEKLREVKAESEAIGLFLDTGGYVLCKHREAGDNGQPEFVWLDGIEEYERPQALRDGEPPTRYHVKRGYAVENPSYQSWGEGMYAVGKPINEILAEYFEIDLAKLDAEKRQMLAELRGEES